ncbi:MAG: PQQ-binding-like beta-propeller repeat protein [Pirellulales bacterium]|nr:PQQ-binding-like beta-propeller repeat protein [Pirellulales bacterium]
MSKSSTILALCGLYLLPTLVWAENWPGFRGPSGDGQIAAGRLPVEWGSEQNLAWKVAVPGVAWSQPVVWNDRIFLTTAVADDQPRPDSAPQGRGRRPEGRPAEGAEPQGNGEGRPRGRAPGGTEPPEAVYRWMVMCLDRNSGKVLWEQVAHEGRPTISIHRTNTYASETPVTDGEHVYAYFGMTGLYCYTVDGQLAWSKDLGSYKMTLGWGTGSSPCLYGDRLFVQCDNDEQSFLVALDKQTGDELWRVERDEKSTWSTPYVWKNKSRVELVLGGSKKFRSYDPNDGKLLWELGPMKGRCSATPVGTDDMLYFGVGGGPAGLGPLVAVKAGASGSHELPKAGEANEAVAWLVDKAGPPMASPLVYEGCLYVLEQRGGIVACYDAATGQEHYKQRLEGAKAFTSSPWAYDGKVFCLDESGQTFVLAAGKELKLLGTNKIDDMFWSSVAVAGDGLILRGLNQLYAIEQP